MDKKRDEQEGPPPESAFEAHRHRSDPFEPHERAALADAEAAANDDDLDEDESLEEERLDIADESER
jgi:hypothetical protein